MHVCRRHVLLIRRIRSTNDGQTFSTSHALADKKARAHGRELRARTAQLASSDWALAPSESESAPDLSRVACAGRTVESVCVCVGARVAWVYARVCVRACVR
jgi:hypothetical protein